MLRGSTALDLVLTDGTVARAVAGRVDRRDVRRVHVLVGLALNRWERARAAMCARRGRSAMLDRGQTVPGRRGT